MGDRLLHGLVSCGVRCGVCGRGRGRLGGGDGRRRRRRRQEGGGRRGPRRAEGAAPARSAHAHHAYDTTTTN